MSNRTNKQTAASAASEMDIDFASSQQSNESDERREKVLRETLEKCLAAEAEKKRAQKEKKFLQVAEAHLKHHLETPAQDVRDAMKAIDEIYTAFLLDYAACEDRMQKKLVQLQVLQNNLINLAKEGQKLDEVAIKASSAMHVDGLSKTKAACIAFGKIMGQLKLPADELNDDD